MYNGVELNTFELKLFAQIVQILKSPQKQLVWLLIWLFLIGMTCGLAMIPLLFICIFYSRKCKEIKEFYNSNTFKAAVEKFHSFIEDMNNFSKYVEEKNELDVEEQVQIATRVDNSNFNYKQSAYTPIKSNRMVCDCSLTVLRNAENQPFKYIQKYFDIPTSESSLEYFEDLSKSIEFGKQAIDYRNASTKTIIQMFRSYFDDPYAKKLMDLALIKDVVEFYQKIGLNRFDAKNVSLEPMVFAFRYISPGGNKNQTVNVTFDQKVVDLFVDYLGEDLEKKKSSSYQRSLMTAKLRNYIKERDNYTCQKCHNSLDNEPNLLLEIDHIIPISKGGLSEESNLQTLCWRCNRSKSNKIE